MQMQLTAVGAGFMIKDVGVAVSNQAFVCLRDGPGEGVVGLKMADAKIVLGRGGTAIGPVGVTTQWFPVNLSKHCWLLDTRDLVGRRAKVGIEGGTLLGWLNARVSASFTVLDKYFNVWNQLKVQNVEEIGDFVSAGEIVVEGKLKRMTEDYAYIQTNKGDLKLMELVDKLTSECEKEPEGQ